MAFHISVMPEQAIIRSADASKPTKARVDDTNHPKILVDFEDGETQYAVVRVVLPPQNEVGRFDPDAQLDLQYTSASVLTGNVQFGVKYAIIDLSESQDKALSSEVASTVSSYTGSANTHYGVSFTFTNIFSALDISKRYVLVLQISRKSVASNLGATVSWLGGVFRLNSGGGMWDSEWTTIYDRDFSALADTDILPAGDGDFTLDGKTVYARNVSRMASLDVGPIAGGLNLGLGAVSESSDYYGSTLDGPALEWKLAQFFEGTDFEDRSDVEMRVRWKLAHSGSPDTSKYEHLTTGFRTSDHDVNRRLQVLQGGIPGNLDNRQVSTEITGSLAYGELAKDDADIVYMPNVLEAQWLENYCAFSYSASDSSEIGDDLIPQYAVERTAVNQRLLKQAGAPKEAIFFFAHGKNTGVAGFTNIILVHLQIFARFSPRGLGVFVP